MRLKALSRPLLFLALSTLSFISRAEGFTPQIWLATGFWSHHLSTAKAPAGGYNQQNTGVGLEYVFSPDWSVDFGQFKNSYYATSHYAQLSYSPEVVSTRIGQATLSARLAAGVVDGYQSRNNGNASFTVIPSVALEWQRAGINFTFVPATLGVTTEVIAVQFKLKLN